MCVVDSLGCESGFSSFNGTQSLIEELLVKLHSPRVFVLKDRRQYSLFGCLVYSLDDVRHLHTLERNLPAGYISLGMFGYFEGIECCARALGGV